MDSLAQKTCSTTTFLSNAFRDQGVCGMMLTLNHWKITDTKAGRGLHFQNSLV